jgi:hypothetical protein
MSAPIAGTFTPPKDLRPAIESLTPKGRQKLADLVDENGGIIETWMIARAADYERGDIYG